MKYVIRLYRIDGHDYYRGENAERTSLLERAKRHNTRRGAERVEKKICWAYPSIKIVEVDE